MSQIILSLIWMAAFVGWGWGCYRIGRAIERSERYYAMARRVLRPRPPDPSDPTDPNVIKLLRKRSF